MTARQRQAQEKAIAKAFEETMDWTFLPELPAELAKIAVSVIEQRKAA
jgi:hypothetical protein